MAVKLLDLSSLKRDLELHPGFIVKTKYLSRPTLAALSRETDGLPAEESARKWADAAVAGWTGLTPTIARALNVPVDDASAGPDGFIPYDAEAAGLLWLYGDANKVEVKLTTFAFRMLDAVEKEKSAAKNGSGAS